MKVAFVISSLSTDGPVNAFFNYAQALLAEDVEVHVVSLNSIHHDVRRTDFERIGVRVINFDPADRGHFKNLINFRGFLKEKNFDIVMSTCIRADFTVMLARIALRIRSGTFVQNVPSEDLVFLYPGVKGRWLSKFHYWIIRKFQPYVVSVSDAVRDRISRDEGIDSIKILNPLQVKISSSTEAGLAREGVVYAASLTSRKNPEEALNFYLQSDIFRSSVPMRIYGEGPLESGLKNKFSKYSEFHWRGFVDDLPTVLRSARVYISSSLSEGLPLVPQMALLNGCPCVLSDIPQHREIARLSKHVFLYKRGDALGFNEALNEAMDSNYRKIQQDANDLGQVVSPRASALAVLKLFEN